ncbi:MAG: hypothetical protein WEC00_09550 [Dongiaceae bacterium]
MRSARVLGQIAVPRERNGSHIRPDMIVYITTRLGHRPIAGSYPHLPEDLRYWSETHLWIA